MFTGKPLIRPIVIRRTGAAVLAVLLLCCTGALFAQDPDSEDSGAQPLVLQPGSVLTVRIDQALSSDRNKPGDSFSATLTQPVVVQGIVVAQRGQTVTGTVVEVERAHGFSGTSQLRLALTRLVLVDGQNVPIHTQLLNHRGRSSTGRDVGAVGVTTATGAVIGAAAGRGEGAAIGAGAGAVAGLIGVLLTKGYPTIVYPETLLTFETTNSVAIDTTAAPQAFHAVNPAVYAQNAEPQLQPRVEAAIETPPGVVARPHVVYPYPVAYDPYYDPYYGPYCDPYWYPSCYGPQVRVIVGRPYYRGYYRSYPRYYGRSYVGGPPIRVHGDYGRDSYRHDDGGRGGRDGGGRHDGGGRRR